MIDGVILAVAPRGARVAVLAIALGYAALYLLLARAIVIDQAARFSRFVSAPSLVVAPGLEPRHLFDPVNPPVIVYLGDAVALAPTAPLVAGALVIGVLLGANVAVAAATLRCRAAQCAQSAAAGVLATLPGFLAAYSCCVPTLALLLGGNVALASLAVAPVAWPLTVVFLVTSLGWSGRRLSALARGDVARGEVAPS